VDQLVDEQNPACWELVVGAVNAYGSGSQTVSVRGALSASAFFYGAP
jgi:hypothetical protein